MTDAENQPDTQNDPAAPRARDLSQIGDIYELAKSGTDSEIKKELSDHISKLEAASSLTTYNIVYLFDESSNISSYHSNQIYEAASSFTEKKNLLLVIQSSGGSIEPAYLISKTCKRLSKAKFVVSVPRRAKSAATLVCLGADEIHMGLLSELGPIDPQINGYPALGLTNALNKVAELSSRFPKSSQMWSEYLGEKLDLNDLGYFDRVTESAAQYAERLMKSKKVPAGQTPQTLANHFVNHYKDHSFVIDSDEATTLLGSNIVKTSTKEYEFGNEIFGFLNLVDLFLGIRNKQARLVGSAQSIWVMDKPKE